MTKFHVALVVGAAACVSLAGPAFAIDQSLPAATEEAPAAQADYMDDRSTPVSLIGSLYNAIDRHEYLRAWSYFAEDSEDFC